MTVKDALVTFLVLLALAVAADRVSLVVAQHAVALQLQVSGSLSSRPDVTVHGIPFLTQAFAGKYDDVEVSASNVTAGGGRISELDVSLRGVKVPLSDAIAGNVNEVPVDGVRATLLLSYEEMNKQVRDRRLTVSGDGDEVRVTGTVQVLGRTVAASAISGLKVSGTSVIVTAQRFEVGNKLADRAVTAALAGRFDFVIRLGTLPYGLKLTGLKAAPRGVIATAAGGPTVLRRTAEVAPPVS